MFWQRKKTGNRRLDRHEVLDVKLRSAPLKAARWRAASLIACGCFAAALGFMLFWKGSEWVLKKMVFENDTFAIHTVDAQSDGVISEEKLRLWSRVRVGDNLFALDLARVRRDLELAPLVQSAEVERVLPNTLRIRTRERIPVAQVLVPQMRAAQGGIDPAPLRYFLDQDGYVLLPVPGIQPASMIQETEDLLPLLFGANPFGFKLGEAVTNQKVKSALRLLEAFQRSELYGVEDIRSVDLTTPQVMTIVTGNGTEVSFSEEAPEPQLARWNRLRGESVRMGKVIAWVDLSITNNVPLRWHEAAVTPAPGKPQLKTQRPWKRHA